MRLTVFGATGGTGRQLVRQALAAGHEVIAVVRDPARLDVTHDRLDVVSADVMDIGAIMPAIKGSDGVLSALGSRTRGPTEVCTESVRSIDAAMRAADVHRLVVVSAAGAFTDGDDAFSRALVKPLLGRIFRYAFADMRRMEQLVRSSGLAWTIVRPPMLTDKPGTGRYRTAWDSNVRGSFRVSRADLAACMLALVTDERAVGQVVGVSG